MCLRPDAVTLFKARIRSQKQRRFGNVRDMFPVANWFPANRKKGLLALAAILLLLIAGSTGAAPLPQSEYIINSWSTEDGLPQNSVTAIAQTSDGYLWLGTFNGLVRFDGARFVVFDPSTTPQLKSSRIVSLLADRRGRLWILSEFWDLARLDGQGFVSSPKKPREFIEDSKGEIWFRSTTEMERLDGDARIALVQDDPDFGYVREVVCDRDGAFWAVRKAGIGRLKSGQFEFSRGLFGDDETPTKILPSRDGGLWAALKSAGLTKYRTGKCVLPPQSFPVSAPSARALLEDSQGNIWIGTQAHGLLLFSTNGGWQVFNTTNGLTHESVRSVYEDAEGNIWVGTDGGGLNRLTKRTFTVRAAAYGVALTVTEDRRGQMWIGFNGEAIKRVENDEVRPVIFPPVVMDKGQCWSLFGDRNRDIWANDYASGGLLRFHDEKLDMLQPSDPERRRTVHALFEDRSGSIWAGYTHGLSRYDRTNFTEFRREAGLPLNDVRALSEDKQGRLLIGCNGGGLVRRDRDAFKVYTRTNGLPDDRIWSLYTDSEGTVWVGTFGSGLSRFRDERFFNFQQALPVKVVTTILEDDLGSLWLGTLKGILRVKRSDLNAFAESKATTVVYQQYGKGDGLQSIECSGGLQPAGWKTHDGKLWFATLKGVAVVDPKHVPFNFRPPSVAIEETLVDDEPYPLSLDQGTGRVRALCVPPGRSRLEFRYTAFSFTAPEKVQFKHRLKGVDRNWIDAGNRRTASYMNVNPGRYELEVAACNNDGVWNNSGATLAVVVLPFFWQTTWFRALMIVIGVTSVVLAVRYLSQRKLRRQLALIEREQAVHRERARIAQDIHDDFGARLTQVNLLSELARRHVSESGEVLKHVDKIAEQTHTMAQVMDEIVWAVDPSKDTVENVASYLVSFAEEFLTPASIHCRIDVPSELPDVRIPAKVRHSIFLVVKEILNNTVKHSRASEVRLRLSIENGSLRIGIEDNGCGFDAVAPSVANGNGLGNMERRIRDLGGEFERTSAPGRGTKVAFTVPSGPYLLQTGYRTIPTPKSS
jgi:ligand-binding sensor domain-containing protein/signal transduction histidine kinase